MATDLADAPARPPFILFSHAIAQESKHVLKFGLILGVGGHQVFMSLQNETGTFHFAAFFKLQGRISQRRTEW